jgi:phosphatidylserine/phosphatidylglycerophosphate/cardiolipin synthase-like enzyme
MIDAQIVITGSFSFTAAAEERNAESLLVMHDPPLAARFTENWAIHVAHSTKYAGH